MAHAKAGTRPEVLDRFGSRETRRGVTPRRLPSGVTGLGGGVTSRKLSVRGFVTLSEPAAWGNDQYPPAILV
jgi:hypothetical protein